MATTYKCPSCGAPITFDGTSGNMTCEFCGTQVEVSQMDAIKDVFSEDVIDDTEKDKEYCSFDGYKCESCGAEIVTDENTSATFCSFCGNPTMIKDRLSNALKPRKVIPFKVSKQAAIDTYRTWTGKGLLTPSGFRKQSTIEKISGIYVPFWLYDYSSRGYLSFNAEKHSTERRGDTVYNHTDHFKIIRDIGADYDNIPADASEKMDDRTMDLLEPFDYKELVDFQMPYLSGYLSEKYTYDAVQMSPRIEKRIKEYLVEEGRKTIAGYSSVSLIDARYNLSRKKADYALLPVWILNYKYNGKMYTFAMNGQTGKVVGKPPYSLAKLLGWFTGITAVGSSILYLLGGLLG